MEAMNEKANRTVPQKREWTAPVLVRLGTIRDIAGGGGAGRQSPVQLRS